MKDKYTLAGVDVAEWIFKRLVKCAGRNWRL